MTLPTWVPEEETKPAPMPLLVVQSFVNTWEGDSGVDLLGDPIEGPRWLEDTGLGHGADVDLAQAREIRESIRALLVQNSGGEAPGPAPLATLRVLADATQLRPAVRDDGTVDVQPDGGPCVGGAAPDHPRCAARRFLGAVEGMSQSGLPLGLLRPLTCGPRRLVRHGGVRQPDEEPESALAPVGP